MGIMPTLSILVKGGFMIDSETKALVDAFWRYARKEITQEQLAFFCESRQDGTIVQLSLFPRVL